MRSNRTPAVYFDDILRAIALLRAYCAELDLATFEEQQGKQDAILYRLLVLTEAAHRLREDELALCPGPNWRKIRDLGNVIRHAYDAIDRATIWEIIHSDLPPLKEALELTMRKHFPDVPLP
ncbi:HepT-like ribonuclease domain-containing protein [Granulicella paludicola]|uniref:HepT-like ribonuclease domain-containing protein n=1 Tax=Granulicella paludicola TaxID=474951 RepID=UPI0021E0EF73|nr:HepT-like ribonuclease domain-containing protein [Granulicella paludicola]